MNSSRLKLLLIVLSAGGLLAWAVIARLGSGHDARPARERGPAAVEVAAIEQGAVEWRRTFSGTLEARARFVLASHVSGRVRRLLVDLSDPVERGQVVAELDDEEPAQAVAQALAAVAVARARQIEARDAHAIAEREYQRARELSARGVTSTSDVDTAKAAYLRQKAAIDVAGAELARANAALRLARIRSGYSNVIATWLGDDDRRVVAERHVAEGDMVAPNAPLFTVVDLQPIDAVVHVTEKEYGHLERDQLATVTTDAHPDQTFQGSVRRIAPVFSEMSRQARVEIELPNTDELLKPGMFVRVEVVLDRVEAATVVPAQALVTRDDRTGVFLVDDSGARVSWRPVEVGIRDGHRVEVRGLEPSGRVVTLGHQLVDDGAAIDIVTKPALTRGDEDS